LRIVRYMVDRKSRLRSPAARQAFFERVIGVLFIGGYARWVGKKRGRRLAAA